jgi:hypothetical protein
MFAVEYRGGQDFITVGSIFIAKFADMVGDAENFLNKHKATPPFALWFGMVDGYFGAIGHCHFDHLAHISTSIVIPALAGIHGLTLLFAQWLRGIDSLVHGFPPTRE